MTAPVLHWPKLFEGQVCPEGEPAYNGRGSGYGYGNGSGNGWGDSDYDGNDID